MGSLQVLLEKGSGASVGGTKLLMHSAPGWEKLPPPHVHIAPHYVIPTASYG